MEVEIGGGDGVVCETKKRERDRERERERERRGAEIGDLMPQTQP